MSPENYAFERLNRNEARKLVSKILAETPANVVFSKHAREEMANDGLSPVDVDNVLRSSSAQILTEAEEKYGKYTYRLETSFIMVVMAFWPRGNGFTIVTVWDKRNKK